MEFAGEVGRAGIGPFESKGSDEDGPWRAQQGPIHALEDRNCRVGVVEGIVGIKERRYGLP